MKLPTVYNLPWITLGLIMPLSSLAQEPSITPAIEEVVHQYILKHPEVLIESVRLYQERELTANREKTKKAVMARLTDLQQDPSSPTAGPADGLTIVEFFDYHCGYCKRSDPAVMKLLADHPDVRVVFKEYPIFGAESTLAAKAGLAASRQGAYLKFHQALMAVSGSITLSAIEKLAEQQGLNVATLKHDMESPEIQSILEHNRELGLKLGLNATPTFVMGSELVAEAMDTPKIERLLARAKPSHKE